MRLMTHKRWVVAAAIAASALAALAVAIGLIHSDRNEPRAREYTSKRACLLTDTNGVAADPAATVWQGMQDASASTHAQISFQPATGSTPAEALPYLNALTEQGCGVIVAMGENQVPAGQQAASANLNVQFVLITPTAAKSTDNIQGLSSEDRHLREHVKDAIAQLTS